MCIFLYVYIYIFLYKLTSTDGHQMLLGKIELHIELC